MWYRSKNVMCVDAASAVECEYEDFGRPDLLFVPLWLVNDLQIAPQESAARRMKQI